jgi:hypothetical protein
MTTRESRPAIVFGMLLAAGVWPTALHACPVCFRMEDGSAADGLRAGVGVLIGVTLVVLGAAARFVVLFTRRAARLADVPDES